MDCLLCSSPDGKNEDDSVDLKNKSFHQLDYALAEKYARSLCQLLDLPSATYQEHFLLPNIGFCISCTHLVGTITRIFEQLEQLQMQISESKDQVQDRLLNCHCHCPDDGDPLRYSSSTMSVDILRQEIVKSIKDRRGDETNGNGDHSIINSDDDDGRGHCDEIIFPDEIKEEVELYNTLPTPDNCWSPPPPSNQNQSDEANDDQSVMPSTSSSKKIGSKTPRKRKWNALEANENEKERSPTPGLKRNKILKIGVTRLDDSMLKNQTADSNELLRKSPETTTAETPTPLTFGKGHKILPSKRKSTQCPHCPKTFLAPEKFKTHMKMHTGESHCICEVCGEKLKDKPHLKKHMMKVHNDQQQRFSCPQCPNTFLTTKTNLKNHVAHVHNKERPFMCELCSAAFSFNQELKFHQANMHAKELNLNPLQCRICDKILSSPANLTSHENAHKDELNYKCNVSSCEFRCATSSRLKIHMISHTDERNHKCPECDKSFKRKGALMEHLRTHKEERPHKCNECPASFKHISHFRRHIATMHSKSNPFACQLCGQRFPVQRYLDLHIEKHTSGKLPILGQTD